MTSPPDRTASVRHEAPLDLAATLRPLRMGLHDRSARFEEPEAPHGGGRVRLAFRTPQGPVSLLIEHELDPDSEPRLLPGLRPLGRVHGAAWGPGSDWALERFGDLVGLADDPASFRPDHPLVRRLHRHRLGRRLPITHRVADLVAPVILQQLVTWKDAVTGWTRLCYRLEERAPGPLELWLPPPMEGLARLSTGRYVESGVLEKQALTLRRVARVASRLDALDGKSAHEVYRAMTSIRGVGPWTAASAMIGGMGFADAVPVGDFHMPKDVAWALAREPRADDARMLELLAPFAGQRGRVVRLLQLGGRKPPRYGPRSAIRRIERI